MEADPQERDRRRGPIIRAAYHRARREIGPLADAMGGCHAVWARQQAILREEYGIEWRTPAEMNPGTIFD